MSKRDLTEALRALSLREGAELFGVADASGFLGEQYSGNRPQQIWGDFGCVVVVGVGLPKGCLAPLPKGRAEYTNTLLSATAILRILAFKLAKRIEREGFKATLVPSEGREFGYSYMDQALKGDVSLKYAAYLAGLGSYGLNHLLITESYGPRVRLTALLTDAPLKAGQPSKTDLTERCNQCLKCVEICPVNALTPKGEIHRERCHDYMFNTLGGLRCGLCVKVCPL